MKKYIAFILPLCLLALLAACNDDAGNDSQTGTGQGQPVALSVSTDINNPQLRSTRSTKDASDFFRLGSSLGLFVSHVGNIDNIYRVFGEGKNVRSIYNAYGWLQEPAVLLGSAPANVYAYYPYNDDHTNPRYIPIEHTSQTDYLYSTHESNQQEVNRYNPTITLQMNHALALLEFRISGPVNMVNRVEILNGMATPVMFSRGTMDLSTGEITVHHEWGEPVKWENDGSVYINREHLRLLVMPTNLTGTGGYGYVNVEMLIDGEFYNWAVPGGTIWRSGTRNIYRLQIRGRELIVEDVIIEPWLPGIDQTYPLD